MFTIRSLTFCGLGLLLVTAVSLYPFSSVTIDLEVLWGSVALLTVFAGVYAFARLVLRNRPVDQLTDSGRKRVRFFLELLEVLMVWQAFPVLVTVSSYIVTPFGAELADGHLAAFDRAIGIDSARVIAYMAEHPTLDTIMDRIYAFMIPQVGFLALFFVCWRKNIDRVWESFALVIFGTAVGLVFHVLLPATGPIHHLGEELKPGQQMFLDHLAGLRSGEPFYMDNATGIITFPSFHVYIALVVAWAFRDEKYLFVPLFVLNGLVCVSTLTTGWHYAADVLAGIAWLAFWIWLVNRLTRSPRQNEELCGENLSAAEPV